LELGCGTGSNFALLEDVIGPKGKIIGVDITDKMLDQARKRIEINGWKNVELVLADIADYKIPKDIDGIIALGALTYSPEYDTVIKNGYDALKSGKRFVVFDTKMSERPARIFAPILLLFTKPFGVGKDYIKRHPWKSIKKYFEGNTYEEGYGGFIYLTVGIKKK
jgi:demethylmenaquinone methyltransferase/2-methoxy-6-polyprenyl-1,4-benzoquinol methylase